MEDFRSYFKEIDKKIKPIFEEVTQLTKRISDSTGEKTIVPR